MANVIIAAQTTAKDSGAFHIREDDPVTIFTMGGVLVSEVVTIQISHDGGTTWSGTGQTLTADEPCFVGYGPGTYRASKPITANSVGVAISSKVYGL